MGSVHTKDNIATKTSTSVSTERITQVEYLSPLHSSAIISSVSHEIQDPRSPGYNRTPVSTPPPSRQYRDKVLMRLGSGSKLDPRSPAAKRTPLHLVASDVSIRRTPPSPFNLGDPRSPLVMRTPLALSAHDAVVVPDDIAIVEEEKVADNEVVAKPAPEESIIITAEKTEVEVASSTGTESTSQKVTTEIFSPDVQPSATIMALVQSPMHSPHGRKRKDLTHVASHSPLKKSFSAPLTLDENHPPSPIVRKPITSVTTKARTPLSPLSQRAMNSRLCVGVQPIKFRMDPGILG